MFTTLHFWAGFAIGWITLIALTWIALWVLSKFIEADEAELDDE